MSGLSFIEGIGKSYIAKLEAAGVKSIEALLDRCATKSGRAELAAKLEISEILVLKWANQADLSRVKGIGGEYAELLEASGVDTVPELAMRNSENLFKKMQEINEAKQLVRRLPTQEQIEDWVRQAATLPRVIQY